MNDINKKNKNDMANNLNLNISRAAVEKRNQPATDISAPAKKRKMNLSTPRENKAILDEDSPSATLAGITPIWRSTCQDLIDPDCCDKSNEGDVNTNLSD